MCPVHRERWKRINARSGFHSGRSSWSVSMSPRKYKDHRIYCCFALNRLVSALDIDLYQSDLEEKLDEILASSKATVTKEEIKHEIMSNHYMTTKVLQELESDGLVEVRREDKGYNIRITKKGVLYIRKYNEFYQRVYQDHIKEHYKYRGLPAWFKGED